MGHQTANSVCLQSGCVKVREVRGEEERQQSQTGGNFEGW